MDTNRRIRSAAVVGQQKGNASQIRLWGRVMDKIELTEQEKASIEFIVLPDGVRWNVAKALEAPAKEVKLEEEEAHPLQGILANWGGFLPTDRSWLLPLLDALEKK